MPKISEATNIDAIQLQEQTAVPATDPAAGYLQLYVLDDKSLNLTDSESQDYGIAMAAATSVADGTVANSASEANLYGTLAGDSILPADSLSVGRMVRLTALGYMSNTGTPDITFTARVNATDIADVTITTASGLSNTFFKVEFLITCRTEGASGTLQGGGTVQIGTNVYGAVNTSTVVMDTTQSNDVDLRVQWGTADASNTITVQQYLVEVLA